MHAVRMSADDMLTGLTSVLPDHGPMRLDAEALALFDTLEHECRFPLVDYLDALRFEAPADQSRARRSIVRRAAYAVGRARSEARQGVEPQAAMEEVSELIDRMRLAGSRNDYPELALCEGILDGLASLVLDRLDAVPEVPLVIAPGPAPYRNEVDLAVRFSDHVRTLGAEEVEAMLGRAKAAFAVAADHAQEADGIETWLGRIAVRRVEIALAREEAEARAEERVCRDVRAALEEGVGPVVALRRARRGPDAGPRDRSLVLPSHRLLPED